LLLWLFFSGNLLKVRNARKAGDASVSGGSTTPASLVSAALGGDLSGQILSLDDGREFKPHHVWAHRGRRAGVLAIENGLARSDERGQSITLVILLALLVKSPIEIGLEGLGLVDVVLETNGETNSVGAGSDELVEAELIGSSDGEARVVFISINIVGLNTITSLGNSEVQTLNHDVADNGRADVDVVLTLPTVEAIPNNRGGERRGVWSPVLVLSAEVADNDSPL